MNEGEKRTIFWAILSLAGGLASIAAWFGITPSSFGETIYGFIHPILPIATFVFGFLSGALCRDYIKQYDARIRMRIEQENKLFDEKMRLEQEKREASRAKEAQEKAYRDKLEKMAVKFKGYDFSAKIMVCKAYDNDGVALPMWLDGVFEEWANQTDAMMECETLSDGRVLYTVKPIIRDLIDMHPGLLDQARKYLKDEELREKTERMKANPNLLLSKMSVDELRVLQDIVDNGGMLDAEAKSGAINCDTLLNYDLLYLLPTEPASDPLFKLDDNIFNFLKHEENEHLIAMCISDHNKLIDSAQGGGDFTVD